MKLPQTGSGFFPTDPDLFRIDPDLFHTNPDLANALDTTDLDIANAF